MPYIGCQLNKKLTKDQAYRIERRMGKSIELFEGINEEVLMVAVQDDTSMTFKGDAEVPMAFLDVRILSKALKDDQDFAIPAKDMMKIIEEEAGVPEENIYITFASVKNWGRKHGDLYML